eukprot:COSAG03_NODE_2559_length_2647_cov_79.376374_2_plen_40_part_00
MLEKKENRANSQTSGIGADVHSGGALMAAHGAGVRSGTA